MKSNNWLWVAFFMLLSFTSLGLFVMAFIHKMPVLGCLMLLVWVFCSVEAALNAPKDN